MMKQRGRKWLSGCLVAGLLAATLHLPAATEVHAAVAGIDLVAEFSSGSSSGTVGSAMNMTLRVYNNGDTATPSSQNIAVEMYVDGEKTAAQSFAPVAPNAFSFGPNGGASWDRTMNWSWTPTADGVHLLEFKVVYDNYTDVDKANNFHIWTVNVDEPADGVEDYVDFGDGTSETSHNLSSSAGGTDDYTETIGNVTDAFDARYSGGDGSWFSVDVDNASGKYGTLAIREQHLTVSPDYRHAASNPDQTGTGTNEMTIDVNQPQGQTFTTGPDTTYLSSIAVKLDKVGLDNDYSFFNNLYLRLYESPSKNKLLSEAWINPTYVKTGADWMLFSFEESVGVLPGTSYYFEFTIAGAPDNDEKYRLYGYANSTYAGGVWYDNGVAQTGKTLRFKTGPDITTTYDVEIDGVQVGGYDQLATGSGMAGVDVNNGSEVGQTFTVGRTTELQAIAVALQKTGTIPANNAIRLTLHSTPVKETAGYLSADPWSTPVLAEALLTPQAVAGGYALSTFVFPQKVPVYPGRKYYFRLSTVLSFDNSNKYSVGVFGTGGYTNRGDFYVNHAKQANKSLSFKTGANPTFNTRSLHDKGNGALTYYIDFPTTYAGASIAVKFVNRNDNPIHIDKLWNYTGFNSYAAAYDTPLYYAPMVQRGEHIANANLGDEVDLITTHVDPRSDGYLGGNTIGYAFSIEHLYALRRNADPSAELAYILDVAKQKGVPVNIYYNSLWGGTPIDFQPSPRYSQIMYSETDFNRDPNIDVLTPALGYATNEGYGLTTPNVWGSTPWLTFNNGGFVNPAAGTLNRHRLEKMGQSADRLNLGMLDVINQANGAQVLSVSGDGEPIYWGYQMKETDGNSVVGYPPVNMQKMRVNLTGDFGPDAVAQAANDGVTLDPTDGVGDAEQRWFHSNLTNYNGFIYGNLHDKLNRGVVTIHNNSLSYPADAIRHNGFTQSFMPIRVAIGQYLPQYETGFQEKANAGLESYMKTEDMPVIDRMIGNSGRTAQLNQETGGADAAVAQNFQLSAAIAFMYGLRYMTPYNTIAYDPAPPRMNTSYANEFNAFTGDPIKIATLVDKRRKSLVTAAERDAYHLREDVEPQLPAGDATAQAFRSAANAAYAAHDFKGAYENYIKAEAAATAILPAPYIVSGTQGTLAPFPLKATAVSGNKANVTVTAYDASSPARLMFTSSSSATGTVNYAIGAPFGGSHNVYVNGVAITPSYGTEITFGVSQTANTPYTVEVTTGAASTVTPIVYTPEPGDNIAMYQSATASSSVEAGNWALDNVNDGLRTSWARAFGWSSSGNLSSNHTEEVTIDLGGNELIRSVSLAPRNDGEMIGPTWTSYEGEGFPIDFTIQVSEDNANWKTVVTRTGHPKPHTPRLFGFDTQIARYVKVQGTSLRPLNGEYRMQFAEIEVYKAPALFTDDFGAGTGQWTQNSGSWSASGGTFDVPLGSNMATIAGEQYADATVSFRLKITDDGGNSANWAGALLRKTNAGDDYGGSGLLFYYRNNGYVSLYKQGAGELQTYDTGVIPSGYVDVRIVMRGNNYKVYVNGSSTPALDVNDSSFASGYLSLRAGVGASYDNVVITGEPTLFRDNFSAGTGQWTENFGAWAVQYGEYGSGSAGSMSTIAGREFANATVSLKLKIADDGGNGTNWAGVLLRKTSAAHDFGDSGLLFYYRNNGQISLHKPGAGDLQTANTGIVPYNFVNVKIVMNGSNYKVYLNGSGTPALDVTDATYSSGYVSLRMHQVEGSFASVSITP